MIYEPREDSFLIKKHISKYAKGKVLDMGTGSGILAEEAKKTAEDVLAVDINPEAVKNAEKKGLKSLKSDLFSAVKGKFDLIIFNPPYLPDDPKEDEDSKLATTGGIKGHEVIERFLKQAKKHLRNEGRILLLFSSLSGDIEEIMGKEGYYFKKIDEEKLFFEKLYVYIIKR